MIISAGEIEDSWVGELSYYVQNLAERGLLQDATVK